MADADNGYEGANLEIDDKIFKSAERIISLEARRKNINDEIASEKSQMETLGVDKFAFMDALRLVKKLDTDQRKSYLTSHRRVMDALSRRQSELFEDRIPDRDADSESDSNPRSDPNAGGAKPLLDNAAEQAEGEAALAEAAPSISGKKKSQSEKAAAKLAAAGLN